MILSQRDYDDFKQQIEYHNDIMALVETDAQTMGTNPPENLWYRVGYGSVKATDIIPIYRWAIGSLSGDWRFIPTAPWIEADDQTDQALIILKWSNE